MSQSLAIKYRPKKFEDVVEQGSTKTILQQQLSSGEIKNAYLFVGSAGTGKTTCARIFANEVNKGLGNPIELDAASNNSVDDVREIIQQAKTQALDSEYKVFIIDECHSLSNSAWQAMLKIIEEPPAKSIFILCTTEAHKVPKTILSRVQRFDFQRISQEGIVVRLEEILDDEGYGLVPDEPVEYIAKLADGGMRDALTMLDKCLAYSNELTIENVIKALGTVDYEIMINLTKAIMNKEKEMIINIIEELHADGKDLKQFIKQYIQFLLDTCKYNVGCDWKYITIPQTYDNEYLSHYYKVWDLLDTIVKLNSDIKYSSTPKSDIEACLLLEVMNDGN